MPSPVLFRRTSDPWGRPSTGAPPLHSARSLLGEPKPRLDAWGRPLVGVDSAPPVLPPTHGFTWAGELLAYRKLWDDYVMGTVRAGLAAGAAYRTLASGGAVSDPTLQPANVQTDLTVYASLAGVMEDTANFDLQNWNQFAGKADWEIMVFAGNYLQEYQRIVKQVGQRDQPYIRRQFPALPLPAPPGLDAQAAVIGRLQGLSIVGSGVLELLGIGASGSLEVAGKVTAEGGKVLGAAADTVVTLADMLPWAIGGIGLLALALIVVAGTKAGSESIGHVSRAVRIVPDPSPRGIDPDALIIVPSSGEPAQLTG